MRWLSKRTSRISGEVEILPEEYSSFESARIQMNEKRSWHSGFGENYDWTVITKQ